MSFFGLPNKFSIGIAIGNGVHDPAKLTDHGELFYHLSFFSVEERDYFKEQTALLVSLVEQEQWLDALEVSNHGRHLIMLNFP